MARRFVWPASFFFALALGGCSLARAPLTAVRTDGGLDARAELDAPVERDGGPDAALDGGPDAGPSDGGTRDPLGAACASGATCASGHCADGVCCDMACDGPCEACTSGIDGTCTPALAGSDPSDDCPAQSADTCGTTGTCDGARACSRYAPGTVCGPSTCTAGVQTLAPTCSAAGLCAASGTMPCTMGCDGPVCSGSCVDDTTCGGTEYCNVATGACVPRLPDGSPSTVPSHCTSGFVADGVCCESACSGTCQACLAAATGAADGECQPVLTGTDPDGDCATTAPSTCDTTGSCDGVGACALFPSGTVCAAASCAAGVESVADECDGAGVCVDAMTRPCDPYVCGVSSCLTSCTTDAECIAGRYCDAGGACVAERALGQACARAGECASGFCADGVCCSAACGGTCEACTVPLRGGGPANGTCGAILAGNDPGMECAALSAATCGTSGACDGARACALHASGTVCAPASCVAGTLTGADTCDGTGTCIDAGSTSCAPYACAASGTACRTTCTVPADCAFGAFCDAGVCRAPLSNGAPCSLGSECGSTFCVDGFCCDGACTGTCVACSAALRGGGADGACGPILAGTDPSAECPTEPASSCDRTGTCNGAGGCSLHSGGTICAPASCAGSTLSTADTCDGSGTCTDAGTSSCAPYLCDAAGTACRTSCATDGDCTATSYCDVDVCRPREANGSGCAGASECTSGNCVDGVCCNAACAGTCTSCAVGGMLGTCVNVPTGTSDPGTCAAPLVCSATAACVRPNAQACTMGSQCLSGVCADGVCCEATCGGMCRACDLAGTVGLCRDVPAGQDPDNECGGGWDCNGSGGCQP